MLVPHTFVALLFWMMVAHALCDYPLQGDWIAVAKNPTSEPGKTLWPWVLPMHGLIHGGAVALITGSVGLGIVEAILHCGIDYTKCRGKISYGQDQLLHWGLKVLYAALLATAFV